MTRSQQKKEEESRRAFKSEQRIHRGNKEFKGEKERYCFYKMSKAPIDENRVLKEGFLTKKGSNLVKQWKERWFVIRGQTLYYYRNPRVWLF